MNTRHVAVLYLVYCLHKIYYMGENRGCYRDGFNCYTVKKKKKKVWKQRKIVESFRFAETNIITANFNLHYFLRSNSSRKLLTAPHYYYLSKRDFIIHPSHFPTRNVEMSNKSARVCTCERSLDLEEKCNGTCSYRYHIYPPKKNPRSRIYSRWIG